MKRLVLLLAAMTVLTMTTFAQGRDLAGSWVFDATKTGKADGPPALTIGLTATAVSVAFGDGAGRTVTFPMDGTEATLDKGVKGKAGWNRDTLEVTTVVPSKDPQVLSFSRSGEWLVMAGKTPEGPMTLYFKKAPPKL